MASSARRDDDADDEDGESEESEEEDGEDGEARAEEAERVLSAAVAASSDELARWPAPLLRWAQREVVLRVAEVRARGRRRTPRLPRRRRRDESGGGAGGGRGDAERDALASETLPKLPAPYVALRALSSGTFGDVFVARREEEAAAAAGSLVAAKRFRVSGDTTNGCGFPASAIREVGILARVRHPNIVRMLDVVVDRDERVFMCMELVAEGDMRAIVSEMDRPFAWGELKCLAAQLLRALAFLASRLIVHRDVKTSNLLYAKGRLKLCDFGAARKFGTARAMTMEAVTLPYRPIELLLHASDGRYGSEVDAWSAGCVLLELALREPLVSAADEGEALGRIFERLGTPLKGGADEHGDAEASHRVWPEFFAGTGVADMARTSDGLVWPELAARQPQGAAASPRSLASFRDLVRRLVAFSPSRRADLALGDAASHAWFLEPPRALDELEMPGAF